MLSTMSYLDSAFVFSDEPRTWGRLAPLPNATGVAGPVAGTDGKLLMVAGGANFPHAPPWKGGRKVWHDQAYILKDPGGQWQDAGQLIRPIGYAVSFSLPMGLELGPGVAYFGGSDAERHYTDGWFLSWRDERLTQSRLPSLPRPCAHACGAVVGNTIYIAGGIEAPDSTSAMHQLWAMRLDRLPLEWKELEPWPGPARMLSVAGSHDGAFFLCSGVSLSAGPDGNPIRTYLRDAYRYHPNHGWTRIADAPRAVAAAPSPTLDVNPSQILVLGGDDGTQSQFKTPEKHPGFPKSTLAYDIQSDSWHLDGHQPVSHVTTTTVFWRDRYVIPSGEVRPGVRSPDVVFITANQ